jgi:hypothetical protein
MTILCGIWSEGNSLHTFSFYLELFKIAPSLAGADTLLRKANIIFDLEDTELCRPHQ